VFCLQKIWFWFGYIWNKRAVRVSRCGLFGYIWNKRAVRGSRCGPFGYFWNKRADRGSRCGPFEIVRPLILCSSLTDGSKLENLVTKKINC
jgi:hypothetical protein